MGEDDLLTGLSLRVYDLFWSESPEERGPDMTLERLRPALLAQRHARTAGARFVAGGGAGSAALGSTA